MANVYLTIGHNVGNTPTHTTTTIAQAVHDVLGIEAFTAIPCIGMWQGMAEQSTRVEVCAVSAEMVEAVRANIARLASALSQEAIMIQTDDAPVSFVDAA